MGAGNTVMADEGIGPRCIEALEAWFTFGDDVDLMDVGTMGLAMLDYLREYTHVVVIDAAKDTGHPAGTVVLYTPEDLAKYQVLHSAHDMRLVDVLKSATLMGIELESVVIVGVQIESMEQWVLGLSPPLEAAIPIACAAALQQLATLDAEFTAKGNVPAEFWDAYSNYA